ncbi:MAG: PhaM family polyhydroxyalkanoate granule multifunctional regulatory protein [Betaproteobacteria bacterium]
MTTPTGAPDYFAMFQSMFTPAGAAQPSASASPMFAMLDPKELERKIGELETVLTWLKATTGMIEVSLQTMRYQQSVLANFADKTAKPVEAVKQPNMEEFAKMASAMNPALWAFNMMQAPLESVPYTKAAKAKAAAPRATAKKSRR